MPLVLRIVVEQVVEQQHEDGDAFNDSRVVLGERSSRRVLRNHARSHPAYTP